MSVPVMTAVAASVLVLGAPVLLSANVAAAGARAASGADAAALAGADALIGLLEDAEHADPCGLATELVTRHGAELVSCFASEETLDVRVTVTVRVGPLALTRMARAGPPDTSENGWAHSGR